jgi:hypothetical protein
MRAIIHKAIERKDSQLPWDHKRRLDGVEEFSVHANLCISGGRRAGGGSRLHALRAKYGMM